MPIETSGGLFWIEQFEPYPGDRRYVHMRLRFEANAFVDAGSIGFVQVVQILIGGEPHGPDDSAVVLARGIPWGQDDAGATIDCSESDRNPVYGLTLNGGGSSGSDLTQGVFDPALGGLGYHGYGGGAATVDAVLEDYPAVSLGYACALRFETAALALSGPDVGRYYGSISWGWERSADGVPQLRAPQLASASRPAPMLRRAVEYWNAAADASGLLALPAPWTGG
jgi:hypothetical protein